MEQPLNERQWRYLRAAEIAAGPANRFRWREVGARLGYSERESWDIISLLERMVAIVRPIEREGQLLPLGRALAHQPLAKPAIARSKSVAKKRPSMPAKKATDAKGKWHAAAPARVRKAAPARSAARRGKTR